MTLDVIFIYGFLGAFAVDFQAFYEEVNKRTFEVVGSPQNYTQVSFWLLQLVHALLAGFLTVAWAQTYPKTDPLTLVAIGGSSRIIILKFGQFVSKNRKVMNNE